MLLVEKVFLLKSISLFEGTSENYLIGVAEIMKEVFVEKGQMIIKKGDAGDYMYIIQSGEVQIHDNEHKIAVLRSKDFLGEMSLLDAESRSASATAITDCYLLKLDQEPFYELLSNNFEVTRGVIKTLCKRLRNQNDATKAATKVQNG